MGQPSEKFVQTRKTAQRQPFCGKGSICRDVWWTAKSPVCKERAQGDHASLPSCAAQRSLSLDFLKGLETSPWRPILFYNSNKHNFVYLVRDNRSWYQLITLKYCGIFEWRNSSNLISNVPFLFNVIILICQLHTYMYLHTHIYTHAFCGVLPLVCTAKSTMFIQILGQIILFSTKAPCPYLYPHHFFPASLV